MRDLLDIDTTGSMNFGKALPPSAPVAARPATATAAAAAKKPEAKMTTPVKPGVLGAYRVIALIVMRTLLFGVLTLRFVDCFVVECSLCDVLTAAVLPFFLAGGPIIIVPGGMSSVLTIYNANDFLADQKCVTTDCFFSLACALVLLLSVLFVLHCEFVLRLLENVFVTVYFVHPLTSVRRFVHTMEKKKETPAKPDKVTFSHTIQSKKLAFKVVDSISELKPQDWCVSISTRCLFSHFVVFVAVPSVPQLRACPSSILSLARLCRDRVVAVFTNGQAWQFKGWKWPDVAELFANGTRPCSVFFLCSARASHDAFGFSHIPIVFCLALFCRACVFTAVLTCECSVCLDAQWRGSMHTLTTKKFQRRFARGTSRGYLYVPSFLPFFPSCARSVRAVFSTPLLCSVRVLIMSIGVDLEAQAAFGRESCA